MKDSPGSVNCAVVCLYCTSSVPSVASRRDGKRRDTWKKCCLTDVTAHPRRRGGSPAGAQCGTSISSIGYHRARGAGSVGRGGNQGGRLVKALLKVKSAYMAAVYSDRPQSLCCSPRLWRKVDFCGVDGLLRRRSGHQLAVLVGWSLTMPPNYSWSPQMVTRPNPCVRVCVSMSRVPARKVEGYRPPAHTSPAFAQGAGLANSCGVTAKELEAFVATG
jgi:hypothetical protein